MNLRALALISVAPVAWAGYGSMGNVESDDEGPLDLGGMVITALVIGAVVLLWKKFF